jgi:O-antigen ligase
MHGGSPMVMVYVILALLGVGLLVALVALFAKWEREDKSYRAPLGLLMMLVVEVTLYSDDNTLPRGLFHPGLGSLQLRLPEVYITLALLGRLVGRGKPKRIGFPAALWGAFGVWLVVSTVEGVLYHNLLSQNVYEAKAIVYVVGGYALAAGVPLQRYLESNAFRYLRNLSVAAGTLVDVMTGLHISVNFHIPLLPLQDFGAVGSTSADFYAAIAIIYFIYQLASGPPRLLSVLALVPGLVCAVQSSQRAVLINLGVVLGVFVVVLVISHGRRVVRRLRVRFSQVVLVLIALFAIGLAVVVVPAAINQQPAHIPLTSTINNTFNSGNQTLASQDRVNMAASVRQLIPQHLFIGWGLGAEFQFYEPGTRTVELTPYAHDVVLDLWFRTGLIGLVLFLLALVVSLIGGLGEWRRDPDPVSGAVALALVAVVAGLFANALLQPLLDEYRLASLLGISLGLLRSAVTSVSMVSTTAVTGRRVQVP